MNNYPENKLCTYADYLTYLENKHIEIIEQTLFYHYNIYEYMSKLLFTSNDYCIGIITFL